MRILAAPTGKRADTGGAVTQILNFRASGLLINYR